MTTEELYRYQEAQLRFHPHIRQDLRYLNFGSSGYPVHVGSTMGYGYGFQPAPTRCSYCHCYHTADVHCKSCGAPR